MCKLGQISKQTKYKALQSFVIWQHLQIDEVCKNEFYFYMASFNFPFQTLGVLRPPLYTMGDGFRGLPAFLTNNFAGNAREEFLHGLVHLKLLTEEQVNEALNSCTRYLAANR